MADPVAILRDELDALARAYSAGHHGRWVARRRAGLIDACLVALWERAGGPAGDDGSIKVEISWSEVG